MIPKLRHLEPSYAAQFKEEPVAEAYQHRPPYPDKVFTILASNLALVEPLQRGRAFGQGRSANP